MTQDKPLCRFCWDIQDTKINPLISPCECKGSLRYIHQLCLNRWRRINPERNAETCLLCLGPYILNEDVEFEYIPNDAKPTVFLLRFPFLLFIFLNYVFAIQITFLPFKGSLYSLFEMYQYAFQVIYFTLFFINWRVKKTRVYWREWNNMKVLMMISIHFFSLYLMHVHNQYLCVLPLNVCLTYYWRNHKLILIKMNHS